MYKARVQVRAGRQWSHDKGQRSFGGRLHTVDLSDQTQDGARRRESNKN